MRYSKNAGAVFNIKYHLVWCSKYRKPVLVNEVETRLKELFNEQAKKYEITIHALEIMPDHVHVFIEAQPTNCITEIVNRFKGHSSRYLRQEFSHLRTKLPCLWSRSYFASTVGHISEEVVKKYIESQKGK